MPLPNTAIVYPIRFNISELQRLDGSFSYLSLRFQLSFWSTPTAHQPHNLQQLKLNERQRFGSLFARRHSEQLQKRSSLFAFRTRDVEGVAMRAQQHHTCCAVRTSFSSQSRSGQRQIAAQTRVQKCRTSICLVNGRWFGFLHAEISKMTAGICLLAQFSRISLSKMLHSAPHPMISFTQRPPVL